MLPFAESVGVSKYKTIFWLLLSSYFKLNYIQKNPRLVIFGFKYEITILEGGL